ncbi:MAG: acyl-CoA dehydrogenase family protein [Dehalococcoidia bacterium]
MNEQELIQAVRELSRTKFVERATAIDREGRFPKENVEELRALGVTGMALPAEFGGLDVTAGTQMRIMEEVAYGDGSTAVALNMHIIVAGFLAIFPPFPHRNTVLEDMGRNGALICGPGSVPSGGLDNRQAGFKAIDDGDDLVFNGKAGFASMSEGAKYTLLGGTVDRGEGNDPDLAVTIPQLGTPGLKLMYNWDAMGLRGTASHDVVAEDVRIPKSEAMVIPQAMLRAIMEAQGQASTVMSQQRARGALGITAIWLGLAQAAFDFTLDYVKQRHGYLAGAGGALGNQPGYRSDQAWAQMGIGNMEHWLESGRIMLYDCVRRLDTPFESVPEFTRHLVRTVYHLRRMSEEVSQGAMKVCGAHAYVRNRPLERIFRDMVGGNVMAWKTDELQQTLGLGSLGMPITFVGPAGT